MNKKIFGVAATLLTIIMMITPLAAAKPWYDTKNNDKFQSFGTTFAFEIPIPNVVIDYSNPNKAIGTWEENMLEYYITVGSETYLLGVDFEYEGVAVVTAIGAPFVITPLGLPNGAKETHFRVDYKYVFTGGPSGIEGTLTMLSLTTSGARRAMTIKSLQGTGDLQNVNIQATQGEGFTHTGIVKGWPETPA